MPLALAIKNRTSVVVASDAVGGPANGERFGQFMPLSDRAVLMVVGNLEGVRAPIESILPRIKPDDSPATVAQLVQAELIVGVVPKMGELKGRVEVIVAGLDPIRHVEQPSLYYMDSAQDFYLKLIETDAVAAGATAAVTALTAGHSYSDSGSDHLKVLAKECFSATKLRWPTALKNHIQIGVITTGGIQVQEY
jgi:hypothetical protein